MSLDVDEARSNHELLADLNALCGWRGREHSRPGDPDDAIATHADVAVVPGIAGAVHDAPAGDHDVVRDIRSWRGGRTTRDQESAQEKPFTPEWHRLPCSRARSASAAR